MNLFAEARAFFENELDIVVTLRDNKVLLDGDTELTIPEFIKEYKRQKLDIKVKDTWNL